MREELFDVAIVGGGPAGLSAAIWLGRYLRSVVVIDSGDPRNWETRAIHGFLGQPGVRPAHLRRAGRKEARHYGVRLRNGHVLRVDPQADERFVLHYDPVERPKALVDGVGNGAVRAPDDNAPRAVTRALVARRVLLAIGLKDVWPQIPGLEQVYGERAHVCPDCDGHETRGRRTVILGAGRKAVATALSLRHFTDQVTVCTNGEPLDMDAYLLERLTDNGVCLVQARVNSLEIEDTTGLRALRMADGTPVHCEELFFAIGQYPADDLAAQLGCERDDNGHVQVDDAYHTSVRNVFAAGDLVPGPQLGIAAAADGAVAAMAIHRSLLPDGAKLRKTMGRPSKPARMLVDWTV
jgi:thioredoxin reductase